MKKNPTAQLCQLNQLILAGQVISEVICHPENRLVFTLQNERGHFFVRWIDPQWQLKQGDLVLVRGALFSVITDNKISTRIDAAEINSLMGH